MGATRFSGPVYGAKALLWTAGPSAAMTTSASTVQAFLQAGYGKRVVPPGEDWIITSASLQCSTASTAAAAQQWKLKTEGGSTTLPRANGQASTNNATVLTIAGGTAAHTLTGVISSNVDGWVVAGVTPGEYEGTWCPSGSTLRWLSSGADIPTLPQMNVYGFIRFVSSTRAE